MLRSLRKMAVLEKSLDVPAAAALPAALTA
jgi:hypothetical protein